MSNNEPAWEDTRHAIEHRGLDNFLGLPWLIYFAGLFSGDGELLGMALALWVLATLIWTPWIIFRVLMGRPTGDGWRATAVLGLGLLPWGAALPAFDWLTTPIGLMIAFPVVALWGGGAMAMAAFQWPRLGSVGARAKLLIAGGVSYLIVALTCAAVFAFTASGDGDLFAWIFALLGVLAATAGIGVLSAASKAPRLSR